MDVYPSAIGVETGFLEAVTKISEDFSRTGFVVDGKTFRTSFHTIFTFFLPRFQFVDYNRKSKNRLSSGAPAKGKEFRKMQTMPILFSPTILQLMLACAAIAILTAVGFYLLRVIQAHSIQRESKTEDHLDYFRELNTQGKLSEREFRIIKKQLSSQIADAVKEEREKSSPPVFRHEVADAVTLLAGQRQTDEDKSDETGKYGEGETTSARR